MPKIKWLPLTGSQETSRRLGYDSKLPKDLVGVCCQEVYDIAWKYLKLMIEDWKKHRCGRMPHWDEIDCGWESKDTLHPAFEVSYGWRDIARQARTEINEFYKKNLNRVALEEEYKAALAQCQIDPKFVFNWKVKHGTKEYLKVNYKNQARKDAFNFVDKVEVETCVFCGEPIMAYDMHMILDGAGQIEMGFGYGSYRDNSLGKGYIHDLCSAKLDQTIFKKRLNWDHCSKDEYERLINIEKSEKTGKLQYYSTKEKYNLRTQKWVDQHKDVIF